MALDRDQTRAHARRRAQRPGEPKTRFTPLTPVTPPITADSPPTIPLILLRRLPEVIEAPGPGEPTESTDVAADPQVQPGNLATPQPPERFVTASDLSQQEIAAQALHSELADVREMLDRPLPPMAAARRSMLSRRGWLLIGVLLMLVLALVAALMLVVPRHQSSPAAGAVRESISGGAARGTPRSNPTGNLVAGLPTSGPGIDTVGSVLGVQVLADQTIDVTEQAVLPAPGLSSFDLKVPALPALNDDLAALRPAIKGLEISVNGSRVDAVPTSSDTWTAAVPAGSQARTVLVRYRLENAVAITQLSVKGRALGIVTPLLAQLMLKQGHPVELRIPAGGVSNVTCIGAPQAQAQCGHVEGTNWNATVPEDATSAAVLLQLDLKS